MSTEKISLQYLYKKIYDTQPLNELFNIRERTYVLVERPQLEAYLCNSYPKSVTSHTVDTSQTKHNGTIINYPPFVLIPPVEVYEEHLLKLPTLEHQTVDNFDQSRWTKAIGTIISTDISTIPKPTAKTRSYIKKKYKDHPDDIQKILTILSDKGDKKHIYTIYCCTPKTNSKSGKLQHLKFSLEYEFTYKEKADVWSEKTDKYKVTMQPYYLTSCNSIINASYSLKKLYEWYVATKKITSV